MSAHIWAIVVAGGDGRRFGRPKQFEDLCGRSVLSWAVESARTVADGVVVVLPAQFVDDPQNYAGASIVVAGGATRSDSVRAGLAVVPNESEIVLVHDAARPLASRELFCAVIHAIEGGADGAIPGVAVVDTIKRVDGDLVTETLDRSELIAVQTPQAFRTDVLRRAHFGDPQATDDAGLVENLGLRVVVVPGERENLKLTELTDLGVLERVLAARVADGVQK